MTQATTQAMQFIANTFGDKFLYEVNRSSFDRLGSSAVYKAHFAEILTREDMLYVIVGTDSGLLPRWLLKDDMPDGSRYLFVELPSLINEVSDLLPELAEHERIGLVTPGDLLAQSEEFCFSDYAFLDRIELVHSIGALDAYLPEYHSVRYAVEKELKEFSRNVKISLGSHNFVQRQIENAADNLVPAGLLTGGFEDQTAVVLGGGPSLDAILPWVRNNRDRLTVIAVSRIAGQLLKAGIEPDIVASVDPQAESFDVSKQMLEFSEKCLLINAYHVSSPLLAQWHGRALYTGPHYPWESKDENENLPVSGPTVSNTALAAAVQMGFSQIVFGGVDLCFSREGYTHASGSVERDSGRSLGNVGLRVETNGGWLADTDPFFKQAADALGVQAEAARTAGCRIINPALHAARMPGVEYLPLEEVRLSEQPRRPFSEVIAPRLPVLGSGFRAQALQTVKKELARVNGRIRAVIKLTEEALDCNRGLFGRNGKQADFKFKKRMDKIERKLDRDFKDVTPLIRNYGIGLFLRLSPPDRERNWTDEELEQYGHAYYEAYRASAQHLLDQVKSAQQRTDSRLAELSDKPDIKALIEQWRSDNTPGRCRAFQAQNATASSTLSEEERGLLEQCEQAFVNILQEKDTAYARRARNTYGIGLAPIRSKLQVLFDTRDTEELARLTEQLSTIEEDEASDLHALAQGYLAEIAGNPDAALSHYNHILDKTASQLASNDELPENPRLEDALRRMSYITLNQGDQKNALMVMDVLSAISPAYEPKYAELLRIAGDTAGAIEVYTDYILKVPEDLTTMLKLGMLYREIGQTESAEWVYRHILEQDPTNDTAAHLLGDLGELTSS